MKKNKASKKPNFKNYLLNTAAAATIAAGIAAPNTQIQAQTQPNTQQQTQMPTNTRIPLEKTKKVAKFFQEGQKDSLLNIIEKNLYALSGNIYDLSSNPNLRAVNGVDFLDLMQIGVNYWGDGKIEGRFKDEHERSQSTTWATYANIAGLTEQELKKSINLTNGIPVHDLKVLYGRDGNYSTVIYTGTEDLGKLIRDREGINGQATIRNHVNKNRGKPFSVPLYSVFNAMGYDFSVPELVQKVDIIKEQKKLLEDRVGELEDKKDELTQEKDSILDEKKDITAKKDSIYQDKTALQEFLRKAEAGAGLFTTNDGDLGYALEIGRGVGKNNATLSLLGVYQPGRTTSESSTPLVERSRDFMPTFDWYGVSTDSITENATKSWQGAKAMVFYELFPNAAPGFSIGAGAQYVRENITNTSNLRNDTWFESDDGVPFMHDSWTSTDVQHKTNNEFSPVVGAKYKLGPVNLFGTYNPSRKEANFGVVLNILQNKYVNDRRRNDSNNNNSMNNSNNVVND